MSSLTLTISLVDWVYYEENQPVGCSHCGLRNISQLPNYYGYQRVFWTALKSIKSLENFKGTTIVRTFALHILKVENGIEVGIAWGKFHLLAMKKH